MWVYVREDRRSGLTAAPAAWFAYTLNRQGLHPQTHLANFDGVLQADAYLTPATIKFTPMAA